MSDREKGWIRTMIEELNSRIEKNSPQMVESLSEIVRIPSKYGEPKEGAPYETSDYLSGIDIGK